MSSNYHAEISILPIGTNSTSLSQYIAKGINSLSKIQGLKYQVTPMGTVFEAENLNQIFEATQAVIDALSKSGVKRSQTILKIDVRHDKKSSLEDKVNSVKKYTS